MAGILANSVSASMVAGDAAVDNAASGYVINEGVTLTTTPAATTYQWTLTRPSGSSAAKAAISDTTAASPIFTPDAAGTYLVGCTVDGSTVYRLSVAVLLSANSNASQVLRLQQVPNATVATPGVSALAVFNSEELEAIATKDNSGVVSQLGWTNVTAYGAKGDGVTDDTVAIQAAIDATPWGTIYFPRGIFIVSSTINIYGKRSVHMVGTGVDLANNIADPSAHRGTELRWNGNNSTPVILLRGSRQCSIRGMVIWFEDAGHTAIEQQTDSIGGSTANSYHDLFIKPHSVSSNYTYGLRLTQGSGGNANNDFTLCQNVTIDGAGEAAVSIEHTQAVRSQFIHCSFGGHGAKYGISSVTSFGVLDGGSSGGNSEADFYLPSAISTQPVYIKGWASESSGCLLDAYAGTSIMRLTLDDVSFNPGSNLRADNRMIDWDCRSLLQMRNCNIGTSTSVAGEVYLNRGGGYVETFQASWEGVTVTSSLANPFTNGCYPRITRGCQVISPSGTDFWGARLTNYQHRRVLDPGFRDGHSNNRFAELYEACPDTDSTYDATPTLIGVADVPVGYYGVANCTVVGVKNDGSAIYSAEIVAHVKNIAGTVTVSSPVTTSKDPSALGYTATLQTAGTYLECYATGAGGTIVRWSCAFRNLTHPIS